MDELSFLFSPIGIVLALTMIAVMAFVLRNAAATAGQQRQVYATLLESAKKASLVPMTVVVPLRRRADTLESLFAELSAHRYEQLDLIVVIYQTAGSRAQAQVRQMARRAGLTIKTIRHKKGLTLERIAHTRARGEAVMLLTAHDRLTARFFEHASYALTQQVTALRVRQFVRLDARMITAFRAVVTLCREAITHAWHRPQRAQQLQRGVLIRRHALARSYKQAAMLFDNFAVERPHEPIHPTWGSVITLGVLLGIVALLVITTPLDVLLYVGALALGVVYIVVSLLIIQHSGYRTHHKLALLFLVPFAPVYYVLWLIRAAARVLFRAATATFRRPRSKRPVRQAQPIRTQ